MGGLYKRPLKSGEKSDIWWAWYWNGGKCHRVSTRTSSEREATKFLRDREGRAARGEAIPVGTDKVRVAELADALVTDYRINARKSIERLEDILAHVREAFGGFRANTLTSDDVKSYIERRQQAGAANATINRELAALKRMYRLAIRGGKLYRAPAIDMLLENNIRTGFFERAQFESLRGVLPSYLRGVVTVAYITGWRIRSEILPLRWANVDFNAGTIRLDPGTTKNKDGRTFVMTPELRTCLEAQRAETEAFQVEHEQIVPWVFHRDGVEIKGFRKAWATACRKAGVPGRIPHDFRRTAVRNLERAGVPRSTAMKMVGHKTESVYRRYAIVTEAELREGAARLAAYSEADGSATMHSSMHSRVVSLGNIVRK